MAPMGPQQDGEIWEVVVRSGACGQQREEILHGVRVVSGVMTRMGLILRVERNLAAKQDTEWSLLVPRGMVACRVGHLAVRWT